ncbi:MAG: helix-turn-helix domain-containing protein [Alistipes sp.]|nr:helix-turn-helix domain-containing protein [Alistipes sp.]
MKHDDILHINFSEIDSEEIHDVALIEEKFAIFRNFSQLPYRSYPARLNFSIMAICLSGSVRTEINLKEYTFAKNDMVISFPDQVIQRIDQSPDFSCCVFTISPQFAQDAALRFQQFLPVLLQLKDHPVIHLEEREVQMILEYYALLQKKTALQHNAFRLEIIVSLLHAICYELGDILKRHAPAEILPKSRKDELFERFVGEVRQHYKEQRSVQFYADKMCLTSKHLSNVLKELTSKTASEWIDNYVILEAKVLLRNTGLTILQISENLNFANQSFFGKYFKQHTGISPTRYRNVGVDVRTERN